MRVSQNQTVIEDKPKMAGGKNAGVFLNKYEAKILKFLDEI
jgi:hypothetical protein